MIPILKNQLTERMSAVTTADPATLRSLESHTAASCALQWRDLLAILGEELGQMLDPSTMVHLLNTVGRQFADAMPLPACVSLADLQKAVNATWARLDWGWAQLSDEGNALRISHGAYPVPVRAGTAPVTPAWIALILEGTYSRWQEQLGAAGLSARWCNPDVAATQPLLFAVARHEV